MPMPQNEGPKKSGERRVWVLQNGEPTPIEVRTGVSDGALTEVMGNALAEGTEVLTNVRTRPPKDGAGRGPL
jgi:HlyD family secretion protein